ncbi:MAG: response regulator, partial [bacterium]|nr:response regulator [bacterium]
MKPIVILMVDDEQPARKKMRTFLNEEEGIAGILEAGNGPEAVALIREKRPDIVFLDIRMPGMSGFEVIEAVGVENMPVVVFVTAYDQYAINAFEVEAVDYLLKPYHQERFQQSFQRALRRLEAGVDESPHIKKESTPHEKKPGEAGAPDMDREDRCEEMGTGAGEAAVMERLLEAIHQGKQSAK